MESQIKELKKGNDQLSVKPTIIIKSVGKAATSFFPLLSPFPDPMLSKTIMFVPVIVLLYPNIEYAALTITKESLQFYVFPT